MRKNLILSLIIFVSCLNNAAGQKYIRNSSLTGICYAGKTVKKVTIPAPDAFFKKSLAKKGSITVSYFNFPTNAVAAFEYAVSILESILPADTRLNVNAYWESLPSDVLGNSVITGLAAGWSVNALDPMVYYPVSLAEKIAGENLNTDEFGDMELRMNRSANWYFGTDGHPGTKYDMVTVVLHELCHGLGFFDSMDTDGGYGYYGFLTVPVIYDMFIENYNGAKLTDTLSFINFSSSLYNQLVSDSVYFNGPLLRNFNNGMRAKLYSPSEFDNGSSISHLDEDNTDYPLMTPFINPGEAIHNPGDLTMSILGDLGWINTRISHQPIGDTEDHLSEISFSVDIESDTVYNRDFVGVVYSFDDFLSSDTILLNSLLSDDHFSASLHLESYNIGLQYYFFVEDEFGRLYRSPSLIDEMRYSSYIGIDTILPVMSHDPVAYCFQTTDSIKISISAYDNIGIDSVYIEYRVNDGPVNFRKLDSGADDTFITYLEPPLMEIEGGDSIFYRLVAIDSSISANSACIPDNDYYSFPVEWIGAAVNSYSTAFTTSTDDFFSIGFDIAKPAGFSSFGLHTKHPYESPEVDYGEIEYTAMLRYPVNFDESGLLVSYDEVVLVEPGEPASEYPSPDFYDYVILEGSKDMGKNWFDLTDGYDSRYLKLWEDAYTDNISGNNSTFVGSETMLRRHVIFKTPSPEITAGDSLLLRFRLYSDPYANGWGWAIQNLEVNALINPTYDNELPEITAYPNPGNGFVNLHGLAGMPFEYDVYNSSGLCLIKDRKSDGTGLIDLSRFQTGLYIIMIRIDHTLISIRYSLIR